MTDKETFKSKLEELFNKAGFTPKAEEKFTKAIIEELEEVFDSADFLECLMAVGVDNWEGYEEAQTLCEESV